MVRPELTRRYLVAPCWENTRSAGLEVLKGRQHTRWISHLSLRKMKIRNCEVLPLDPSSALQVDSIWRFFIRARPCDVRFPRIKPCQLLKPARSLALGLFGVR